MKVNQTTVTHPRLNPVQLPLVGKWWSNNAATRIFLSCAMMTGISSTRSWVAVIFWLLPRAYLNSYFLAIIRAKRKWYTGSTAIGASPNAAMVAVLDVIV